MKTNLRHRRFAERTSSLCLDDSLVEARLLVVKKGLSMREIGERSGMDRFKAFHILEGNDEDEAALKRVLEAIQEMPEGRSKYTGSNRSLTPEIEQLRRCVLRSKLSTKALAEKVRCHPTNIRKALLGYPDVERIRLRLKALFDSCKTQTGRASAA